MISRLFEKFGEDVPIFTDEILDIMKDYSRQRVYQLIDEAIKQERLIRYDRGVYYIPTDTILGKSNISYQEVVHKKYVSNNDDVYGIYGQFFLELKFMYSTQFPMLTEVITNKESSKYREVFIGKRKVIVKKSRITITKENVFAYMLLEFFRDINVDYFINNKYVNIEISKFIKDNNITLNDINKISNYFPSKCIKNINLTGVIYELIRQQTIKEINT